MKKRPLGDTLVQKLNFLGIGHYLNKVDKNSSAFIKDRNYLLLIDCGQDTFSKLIEFNLFENILTVDILLTSQSSFSTGSLVNLILYLNDIKEIKPTIFTHTNNVDTLIKIQSHKTAKYYFNKVVGDNSFDLNNDFNEMTFNIKTFIENDFKKSSFLIEYQDSVIVYNNTHKEYPNIIEIIKNNKNKNIEYYQSYNKIDYLPREVWKYVYFIDVVGDVCENSHYEKLEHFTKEYEEIRDRLPLIYDGNQSFILNETTKFLVSETFLYSMPCSLEQDDFIDMITSVNILNYNKETKEFFVSLEEDNETEKNNRKTKENMLSFEDVIEAIESKTWLLM